LENKLKNIDIDNISTPKSTHILLSNNELKETEHSEDKNNNSNEINREIN
jgi:hypothetical protein